MAGYGTDEKASAYWTAAGYTIPAGGDITAARQRGSAYIDATYGERFTGAPTGGVDQERAWPRTGATAYGSALTTNMIPVRVEHAAYEAAVLELRKPGSLAILTDPARRVKRQKVEGIEREFFEPGAGGNAAAPVLTTIDGMLAPLLQPASMPAVFVV